MLAVYAEQLKMVEAHSLCTCWLWTFDRMRITEGKVQPLRLRTAVLRRDNSVGVDAKARQAIACRTDLKQLQNQSGMNTFARRLRKRPVDDEWYLDGGIANDYSTSTSC